MVNIQYFADKVKTERDAALGPSAGENPIRASNGEVGTRPEASQSISKFANVVDSGCGVPFNVGDITFELLVSSEESAYWVMKGTLPAAVSIPLHSHGDEESFYLISGEAQFLAPTPRGLQWKTLRQGDFVHHPKRCKACLAQPVHGYGRSPFGHHTEVRSLPLGNRTVCRHGGHRRLAEQACEPVGILWILDRQPSRECRRRDRAAVEKQIQIPVGEKR